jgi:pimeloyl-ACP methyl ester carboxylesterase
LTAALNWYRANIDPAVRTSGIPNVPVRAMGLWSSGDHYLTEQIVAGSKRFVKGPWRYERIEDASHWLQLDRPQLVNGLILEFLRGE